MRVKIIVLCLIFILISAHISVEAKVGESFIENASCPIISYNISSQPSDPNFEKIKRSIMGAPTAFTENRGQLENDNIRFYVQGGGLWFSDDGVYIEVREELKKQYNNQNNIYTPLINNFHKEPSQFKRVILKQTFIGKNPIIPEARQRCIWTNNFFIGNDSSKWRSNVPNYREIYYENLYNGIDLRYYLIESGLKYDFIIHPGADVNKIRIRYDGAEGLKIDDFGNLIIQTKIRDIVDDRLFIYQQLNGTFLQIHGMYIIYNDLEYGFKILDKYNEHEILVIDPVLEYSTFIGSGATGHGIDVDNAGNAVVTGYAYSFHPTTPGAYDTSLNGGYDVFVSKFNHNGSALIYSTFIGDFRDDYAHDIVIDDQDNVFVTGKTKSPNFPTTSGAYDTSHTNNWFTWDGFVLKLNHNGTELLYSTFVHGTDHDEPQSIAIDSFGNAYVTGYTQSNNFDTTPGANDTSYNGGRDAFVFKLNQTGQKLIYSTYLGGNSNDFGINIDVDSTGKAYITGRTLSNNFPTTPGVLDRTLNNTEVFISVINQTGKGLIYSTYIGGNSADLGNAIKVDSKGNAIITGYTASSDFPTTPTANDTSYNGGAYDCFVLKINQTGEKLLFSSFIGGSGDDRGIDLELAADGTICIAGQTVSNDLYLTDDAYDKTVNGTDIFIAKLTSSATQYLYSTYIGGSNGDYCEAIALDPIGNAYATGWVVSSDFPITPGAYDSTYTSPRDVVVFKFSFKPILFINSLTLMKYGEPTSIVYSRLCPYTFRVNFLYSANLSDFGKVQLILDPSGNNIQFTWDYSTGQFSKLSDPNNYITLEASSNAYKDFFRWTVDFNMTFNWTYPDENFQDVRVFATSVTLPTNWYNVTNFYEIENDLVFNGSLSITGEDERLISENELIRGGEKLNWTGLTTVYENTNDTFPPDEEFDIRIKDDSDNIWEDSPIPGEPFFIGMISQKNTDINGNNFSLSIIGIPVECDLTNEKITILFDGDNVTFLNPIPNNQTWQIKANVLVKVNITDMGGGEVDGKSVMRSITTNNGTNWDDWEKIPGLDSKKSIMVEDVVTLEEGTGNLIRWQAIDSVDNGPAISEPYRIFVDTEDITFSNPWPTGSDVSSTENIEVGITISDSTSGVNASTIEYAVSDNKGNSWGPWKPVDGYEDGLRVDVFINHTFLNGTDNRIKWRASDIAGNGPVESPRYPVVVNTWIQPEKPKVILLSPPNSIIINVTIVELIWELEDKNMESITYDLYFENNTSPNIWRKGIENTSYIFENLKDGEIYYWRVIPRRGDLEGTCTSGIWWFKVDIEIPISIENFELLINGVKSISLYPGENKNVTLTITNLGTIEDTVKLEIDSGELAGYVTLDDNSILDIESKDYQQRILNIKLPDNIQPGIYVIMATAISIKSGELVRDSHTIAVEIKERDSKEPDEPEINGTGENETVGNLTTEGPAKESSQIILYLGIGLIIIIIICLILFAFIIKRKKRKTEELLLPGTFAVKPGSLPSPVITLEQFPAAPTLAQLPSASAGSVTQQPTASTVSIPQLPQSTQVVQPTVSQPTPTVRVPQSLPQLPPAQIQTAIPGTETKESISPSIISSPIPQQPTQIRPPSLDTSKTATQATITPTVIQAPSTISGPTVHLPDSTPKPTIVTSSQPKLTVENNNTPTPTVTTTSVTSQTQQIAQQSQPLPQPKPQIKPQIATEQQQIPQKKTTNDDADD